MKSDVMFSSATDQWSTPIDFFNKVDDVFRFETDVCADAGNAKCEKYFDAEADGLTKRWTGVCWMNPPYGRGIGEWLKKAYESAKGGATVVCLIPARTDTRWWHDYCLKGEIMLIKGRLKFGGSVDGAPFPSALVVFRPSLSDLDVVGQII